MVFFLIFGLFLPRVVVAILYLLTGWFNGLFTTWVWPVAGFILMPYTLLWYTVVMNWYGGVWGALQVIVMIIAVLLDISSYRGKL